MYVERPLKDFLEDVASRTPAPGGGSVAALTGALGSSLLCMVANFTLGKEKFKEVEEEVSIILRELKRCTDKLCRFMEDDISAYANFSRLLSLPKNTPQEKEKREKLLQEALKNAAQVPLKICEYCYELLTHASRLLEIGNPRLVSDVGVGAFLAWAGLESAALNVEINLPGIKDEIFVKERRSSISYFLKHGSQIYHQIRREVRKRIASV
ncbi:cyclodeaminase/cyclohydrolase family protein [Candidatus Aerophobetes bacterium]|nr:cyclodeaminase/cyclohydrolase family protein [Candidatus Aerophobetes bacterium]